MGGKKRFAPTKMSEPLESAISALDKGYTEMVELLHSQEKLIDHLETKNSRTDDVDLLPLEGEVAGRRTQVHPSAFKTLAPDPGEELWVGFAGAHKLARFFETIPNQETPGRLKKCLGVFLSLEKRLGVLINALGFY